MKPCTESREGHRDKDGYAVINHYRHGRRGLLRLHRKAYVEAHGLTLDDIDGLVVRHRCDNPPCVEPDHLILGTIADNNQDIADRGRWRPARGERSGRAKLTAYAVAWIRSLHAEKQANQVELAAMFGVSNSTISVVIRREAWS